MKVVTESWVRWASSPTTWARFSSASCCFSKRASRLRLRCPASSSRSVTFPERSSFAATIPSFQLARLDASASAISTDLVTWSCTRTPRASSASTDSVCSCAVAWEFSSLALARKAPSCPPVVAIASLRFPALACSASDAARASRPSSPATSALASASSTHRETFARSPSMSLVLSSRELMSMFASPVSAPSVTSCSFTTWRVAASSTRVAFSSCRVRSSSIRVSVSSSVNLAHSALDSSKFASSSSFLARSSTISTRMVDRADSHSLSWDLVDSRSRTMPS
mmetsp:Transcript_11286/g.32481  ORF Transcript_11286/g.32481 Transcript_11286/m.32481 type:complete len:282 (-) Transcript_11286:138-983(-)